MIKKPTVIETIRLNKLRWFVHVQRMERRRITQTVLDMNLGEKNREINKEIDGKMRRGRIED